MEDDQIETESDSSPFFGGSAAEAIQTAKLQKRILIVYISGENDECSRMVQTTWNNQKVQKLLREQCVTLHLPDKSSDAAHFYAMYPYHMVPSISVINNNGSRLKHLEGYAQPEELLGILEQSLAVQAAAAIVAALASVNTSSAALTMQSQAMSSSNPSENMDVERGGSSAVSDEIEISSVPSDEKGVESTSCELAVPSSTRSNCLDGTSEPQQSEVEIISEEMTAVPKSGGSDAEAEQVLDLSGCTSFLDEGGSSSSAGLTESNPNVTHQNTGLEAFAAQDGNELSSPKEELPKIQQAMGTFLIQVRLTNGKCIQESFDPKDKLAEVKTFIDQNRDDGNDLYSLAVPYPRKVFSQEDLDTTLVGLNLEDRATLILVKNALQQSKVQAYESSIKQAATSPEVDDPSSTGSMWKIFSYLNPLSYFSGSGHSSSNSEPESSTWQYEPNPNLHISSRTGRAEKFGESNVEASDASKRKKAQERSWGSNIHTLRHNDDDEAFKRGNAFWNGNSTQFGGDDPQK